MTDKEQLELAAKAMGYKYMSGALWDGRDVVEYVWHPQDDDGQALRIAVKLKMCIDIIENASGAHVINYKFCTELHNGDPCAATRKAILRTAAEIGKTL